jgi:hypothetical protein
MQKPNNLSTAESKNLAAYVVLYRTLGINKELAILCMQELCKRRENGDTFEYEQFIDDETAKIPKPSEPKISDAISLVNAVSKGKVIK